MAIQGQEKRSFKQLIADYVYVEYGLTLSDLYLDMILERRLSLVDAVRAFKLHDTGYASNDSQVLH